MTIFCIFVFAIFKGSVLARNIFFIISLPIILIIAIGSVSVLAKLTSGTYNLIETILYGIIIIIPYILLFMRPSQKWFLEINGTDIKKKVFIFSWNFQLTLIVLSISIGVIIMILMYHLLILES